MSIEIVSQDVPLNSAPGTFTFKQPVTQYIAGVTSFSFAYGGDDNHVRRLSISLATNKPSKQTLNVAVTAIMSDGSGNQLDTSRSYVTVTVIAWTGTGTDQVLLSPVVSVGNQQSSAPISLPDANDPILQAVFAGFDLAYESDDRHVQLVQAIVGAQQNGSQGFVTATVNMKDNTVYAAAPTASGALIASSTANPGFLLVPFSDQNVALRRIKMGTPIKQVASFITGFTVQYASGQDHHVWNIGAGPNRVSVDPRDPTVAVTTGVWAWMNDKSGHEQDSASSITSTTRSAAPSRRGRCRGRGSRPGSRPTPPSPRGPIARCRIP